MTKKCDKIRSKGEKKTFSRIIQVFKISDKVFKRHMTKTSQEIDKKMQNTVEK